MASEYKKTAKDIACDKERTKLKCVIHNMKKHQVELEKQIEELKFESELKTQRIHDLEEIVDLLREKMNLSQEDLQTLVKDKKNENDILDLLKMVFKNNLGTGVY